MKNPGLPEKQGLYDPQFEHDACGVGFVVNMKGKKSHEIIDQAITILINLDHRGACGCETNTGDGGGHIDADAAQVPGEGGGESGDHAAGGARVRGGDAFHVAGQGDARGGGEDF